MKLFNEETSNQLKEVFAAMKSDVTIALFTKEEPCETCAETKDFMDEVIELSDKIHLKHYDLVSDAEVAKKYNVTLTPSIVLLDAGENYRGIKFNGIPAGYEVNSFVTGLLEVSGAENDLPESISERLAKVEKPVNIKVFITLSCPHCPGAVEKAHKLALENSNIEADMIEAQTFYELSDKFNVSGVPKIVINDEYELIGNQPLEAFMDVIEKAQAAS